MFKIKITFAILFLLILWGCNHSSTSAGYITRKTDETDNIFADATLQRIYSLQDKRQIAPLISFLQDDNLTYRFHAAMALASVQDTTAVRPLAILLNDKDEAVREAAIYALGQIKNAAAEPFLIEAYDKETSYLLRGLILEAIGKCGTKTGLTLITKLKITSPNEHLLQGQAWGLVRFAIRNQIIPAGTNKILELIKRGNSDKVRFIASQYFIRENKIDIEGHYDDINDAYKAPGFLFTKINLTVAFGKLKEKRSLEHIARIIQSNEDYRILVNALRALKEFSYDEASPIVFAALENKNANVAIKASEYFMDFGVREDSKLYYDAAVKQSNWRAKANMLDAALKYNENQTDLSKSVIVAYQASSNIYEKAFLLKSIGEDVNNYEFVARQVFGNNQHIIQTDAIEALIEMRKNKSFDKISQKSGKDLRKLFVEYFKTAINGGDVAIVATVADLLRDSTYNFVKQLDNTYFLKQALSKLRLPRDIESYVELLKTVDYFFGTHSEIPRFRSDSIDWELVSSIPVKQKVLIKTTKGDIEVELAVNEAPGTVANFIKLIKTKFLNKGVFHRTVPNFVIQAGCPRGDGWGSPENTIRSELYESYYDEGSIGMASSGKDTEGSQWFITLSPTPHLDGRYTIFGKVTNGIKVAHQIEVGDSIIEYKILTHNL